MPCGFKKLFSRFVNPTQIEVRKSVRLITRRKQRPLEPTHRAVRIALSQQVTPNIVVRIAERFVDTNRLQTFVDCFVVTVLKTVNPAEKRVRFGGRVSLDRSLVELDSLFVIVGELRLVSLIEKLICFEAFRFRNVVVGLHNLITVCTCLLRYVETLDASLNLWRDCLRTHRFLYGIGVG